MIILNFELISQLKYTKNGKIQLNYKNKKINTKN